MVLPDGSRRVLRPCPDGWMGGGQAIFCGEVYSVLMGFLVELHSNVR